MNYKNLLDFQLFGNTGQDYLITFVVLVVFVALLKIFQIIVLKKLENIAKKTKTDLDDVLIGIVEKIKPPVYSFVALYGALQFLTLGEVVEKIINGLLILVVVYQIINALQEFINFAVRKLSSEDKKVSSSVVSSISIMAKTVLWSFAVLLILSNWGINISSLVAGLGIGGIAIALAVQKILSDVFSSFSIFVDKPFEEGDFIAVGQDMGVVQKIGIKTTRIKSLQGEELIISNQELTTERVKNFKRMKERRIVFTIGVCYETPVEKLKKIPEMMKDIIEKEELARFDRTHFKTYGDFSLNYEMVYYVTSREYLKYVNTQQSINFALKEKFEKEGIEFAYPTQTIFVKK
jgi:small-conductance mechanosensitive channel